MTQTYKPQKRRMSFTFPIALLKDIDELAGPRGRTKFVVEALQAHFAQDKLVASLPSTTMKAAKVN